MSILRGLKGVSAVLARGLQGFPWLPWYLRFQLHGHGKAWSIFTHLTPVERLLLYRLGLQQGKDAVLLEVGSYLGASACFLAAATKEQGGKARVYCVDTWQNQGMSEGPRDTWEEFHRNIRPFASCIIPLRGDSETVARGFDRTIDLLFLDGDHSYEACSRDVRGWLPRLKKRGTVVFHDYGWAEGVRRAVDEWVVPSQKSRRHIVENTFWCRT
jgi:predicted O-methyltransferase YrrM